MGTWGSACSTSTCSGGGRNAAIRGRPPAARDGATSGRRGADPSRRREAIVQKCEVICNGTAGIVAASSSHSCPDARGAPRRHGAGLARARAGARAAAAPRLRARRALRDAARRARGAGRRARRGRRAAPRRHGDRPGPAAGGRTVAVFGTGIDRVYPSWHRGLAAAIAARGALVSEFPCGAPPLQFHFPRRNRIISGLTRGTVVVEAAEQSGSLITAGYALEQDRQVFAVPGPAGVAAHLGPNRLIQQGARLVVGAEDVVEELWPGLLLRLAARRAAAAEPAPR